MFNTRNAPLNRRRSSSAADRDRFTLVTAQYHHHASVSARDGRATTRGDAHTHTTTAPPKMPREMSLRALGGPHDAGDRDDDIDADGSTGLRSRSRLTASTAPRRSESI
jgi:hypothetical protein